MRSAAIGLSLIALVSARAQQNCPAVHFLVAPSANLKPTATTHIDVVRQPDGAYTGFELTDASPHRLIRATPHFSDQLTACLPAIHAARVPAPTTVPQPVSSQALATIALADGGLLSAAVAPDGAAIHFEVFDSMHSVRSERDFSYSVPEQFVPTNRTDRFLSLAAADVDGDGRMDIAALFTTNRLAGRYDSGIWVFPGKGDGTFATGKRTVLFSSPTTGPGDVFVLADLNGDNKPDLIFGPPVSNISTVAIGKGDGTFNAPLAPDSAGGAATCKWLAAGDFNGDGKTDVACAGETLTIYLGQGNGRFTAGASSSFTDFPPSYSAGPSMVHGLAVGDLNGDGQPDFVNSFGTVLFGDGKGGFSGRADYSVRTHEGVTITDINNDGAPDLVFGNGSPDMISGTADDPALEVLFSDGAGTFAGAPITRASLPGFSSLAAADFNGDGIVDVVTSGGALNFFAGLGRGQFKTPQVISGASAQFAQLLALDLNRDGCADLLAVNPQNNAVEVRLGRGDGSFSDAIRTQFADGVLREVAGDLNGDRTPDLVVTSSTTLHVLLGKGDGSFSEVLTLPAESASATIADLDGDGKPDIAFTRARSTTVSALFGKGDGTFTQKSVGTLPQPAYGFGGILAQDFSGDGRVDLLSQCGPQGLVVNPPGMTALLPGNGDGSFGPAVLSDGNFSGTAADVNGDHILDLAGLDVRLGNGDGTFQSPVELAPGGQSAIVDVNGDGSPDIIGAAAAGFTTVLNLTAMPAPLTVTSAATFLTGPLAPGSFAAAFGNSIGLGSPFSGAGVSVSIGDSAGVIRAARTVYTGRNQINFIVPPGTASGSATVSVIGSIASAAPSATVQISAVSPALFTTGANLPAAYVVQVSDSGAQTTAPLTGAPLDLGAAAQTYLILFGTGFDAASAASVSVSIQGNTVPVTYAGPQGSITGLDQINVALPQSLAGTGQATVIVSAGGVSANAVQITL